MRSRPVAVAAKVDDVKVVRQAVDQLTNAGSGIEPSMGGCCRDIARAQSPNLPARELTAESRSSSSSRFLSSRQSSRQHTETLTHQAYGTTNSHCGGSTPTRPAARRPRVSGAWLSLCSTPTQRSDGRESHLGAGRGSTPPLSEPKKKHTTITEWVGYVALWSHFLCMVPLSVFGEQCCPPRPFSENRKEPLCDPT